MLGPCRIGAGASVRGGNGGRMDKRGAEGMGLAERWQERPLGHRAERWQECALGHREAARARGHRRPRWRRDGASSMSQSALRLAYR